MWPHPCANKGVNVLENEPPKTVSSPNAMANMKDRMARARRSERAGDLAGAIAQYREALVLQEETSGVADLGLYNRIGDLYLKG
jgi:hypothetical protein